MLAHDCQCPSKLLFTLPLHPRATMLPLATAGDLLPTWSPTPVQLAYTQSTTPALWGSLPFPSSLSTHLSPILPIGSVNQLKCSHLKTKTENKPPLAWDPIKCPHFPNPWMIVYTSGNTQENSLPPPVWNRLQQFLSFTKDRAHSSELRSLMASISFTFPNLLSHVAIRAPHRAFLH